MQRNDWSDSIKPIQPTAPQIRLDPLTSDCARYKFYWLIDRYEYNSPIDRCVQVYTTRIPHMHHATVTYCFCWTVILFMYYAVVVFQFGVNVSKVGLGLIMKGTLFKSYYIVLLCLSFYFCHSLYFVYGLFDSSKIRNKWTTEHRK